MSSEQVVLVGLFSVLWFGVGILAGRAMKPAAKPSKGRGRQDRERQPRQQAPQRSRSRTVELYVGNLPYQTSEKELSKAFGRFGEVASVRLIENRRDGKPKGFGFVEMSDEREAAAAIKKMNGADFKGRAMVVNEARSRERG